MTARRLLLRMDEFAALCADLTAELPVAFVPVPTADASTVASSTVGSSAVASLLEVARTCLTERGITGNAYDAVAANLRLFAAAHIVITVDVVVDDESLLGLVCLADHGGATLVHTQGGAVELSLWDIGNLAIELGRVVPPSTASTRATSRAVDAHALVTALALDTGGHHEVAVQALRREGLSLLEAADVLAVAATTYGSMHCVVTDRDSRRPQEVTVAHVVWILTRDGWLGLRRQARGAIEMTPVSPADLGTFVAPFLAATIS